MQYWLKTRLKNGIFFSFEIFIEIASLVPEIVFTLKEYKAYIVKSQET